MKRPSLVFATFALILLTVTACTPHVMYRTNITEVCTSKTVDSSDSVCPEHAVQQLPSGEGNFLLTFIEFDDQGQLWNREQMMFVANKLHEEATKQDLLLVVFAHGWKHSAAPNDSNIIMFRRILAQLSDAEAYIATKYHRTARKVAGVYLGWRGGSVSVPLLKELTFWDRKNTAQKVGYGGMTEALSKLEVVKTTKDSMVCRAAQNKGAATSHICGSNTKLVVVGHSFGGAVIHTALSQVLENRFIRTAGPAGISSDIQGFGDLVVLINPAFEANLFTPLSDMSSERGTYFDTQRPVFLILTSEADWATKKTFPLGRWFSTFFENEDHHHKRHNAVTRQDETVDARGANLTAVGHFEPYRTHRLYPKSETAKRGEFQQASAKETVQAAFLSATPQWKDDQPGSRITFGDVTLERTKTSAARNPYLVTYVHKSLIHDHNDIDDGRIVEFIKQLILMSSHSSTDAEALRQKLDSSP